MKEVGMRHPESIQIKVVTGDEGDPNPLLLSVKTPENPVQGQNILLSPSITGLYLRVRGWNIIVRVSTEAYEWLKKNGSALLPE
jgi:hypothetical protein